MSRKKKRHSKERKLPETAQRSLFSSVLDENEPEEKGSHREPLFKLGKTPDKIFIGDVSSSDYLKSLRLGWISRLRTQIWELDYSEFYSKYEGTGRQPFHPAVMMGLIMYGMLKRQWSLRELENLARIDVGAWVMCGGMQPDHSTIGKFLIRHQDHLTEKFFIDSTKILAQKLKLTGGEAAIDGTVIQAAASGFRTVRAEAAKDQAKRARDHANESGGNAHAEARAEQAERAARIINERVNKSIAKGRDPKKVAIAPGEPEAVVQPQKNKTSRPSYKPSVHVRGPLITGQSVHPSSETAPIPDIVEQDRAIMNDAPAVTMLDAGYFSFGVINFFLERGDDVLIPSGKAGTNNVERKQREGKYFLKNRFKFDGERDVFICPAGQSLKRNHSGTDQSGNYVRYRGTTCAGCPLKSQCTKAKKGRTVKRYEGDDIKDAMIETLQQPRAWEQYKHRSYLAERPFAELKLRQGLQRFRRRNRSGAGLEFSLHCLAFNLGRVTGARGASSFAIFWLSDPENRPILFFLVVWPNFA